MPNKVNELYEFGNFRFDCGKNRLWQNEEIILLSPKASELLKLLLKQNGEFVLKEEIFEEIWADTFVEDGVLTQNIYTLRKILGKDENGNPLIENRSRLGYRITVPIRLTKDDNQLLPLAANNREILLPTQTDTEIITEEIIEEDSSKLFSGAPPTNRKRNLIIFAGMILLTVIGIFGYKLINQYFATPSRVPIENVQLKKVTDTGEVLFPTISPDGAFIAFVKGGQLMLKDVKSNKDVALDVPNHQTFGSLQFSNDGTSIFFRNQKELHLTSGIYQISRFGGEARLIAEDVWTQFGLSPDNRNVAFVRYFANQNYYDLIVKNLDSGEERKLISRKYPEFPAFNASPSWSPDGTHIALTIQDRAKLLSQLVMIDVESNEEKSVQLENFKQIEEIVWLPDNKNIIVSANQTGKFLQLWKIETATGFSQRITNDLSSYQNLSITADGKKLVANQFTQYSNLWTANDAKPENLKQITFSNSTLDGLSAIDWFDDNKIIYVSHEIQKPFQEIWIVNPIDNSRSPLINNTDYLAEFPTASANQKSIFFSSNKTGLLQLWQTDKNGANPTPITFDESGHNGLSVLSHDGNWLYYMNKKGNASSIRRKSMIDGSDSLVFFREDLSPSAWVAVSPDGKRVGFINYADRSPNEGFNRTYQIIVVSTENLNEVSFHKISASNRYFEFSPDSNSLEYIENTANEGKIWRQSLKDENAREVFFSLPKQKIFHFAWSKEGKHLVLAAGQQVNDAVLLTNFE